MLEMSLFISTTAKFVTKEQYTDKVCTLVDYIIPEKCGEKQKEPNRINTTSNGTYKRNADKKKWMKKKLTERKKCDKRRTAKEVKEKLEKK